MATLAASASRSRTTPVHLWVVGVCALLWNAFGAFDYLMTQLDAEWYMGNFTEEQRAYFDSYPAWAVAFWALGVWGAFFGSAALLLRSRWAVTLFAVSLVGMVVSFTYTWFVSGGVEAMDGGAGAWVFTAVIWVVTIGLYLYARAQQRRGVLR